MQQTGIAGDEFDGVAVDTQEGLALRDAEIGIENDPLVNSDAIDKLDRAGSDIV